MELKKVTMTFIKEAEISVNTDELSIFVKN